MEMYFERQYLGLPTDTELKPVTACANQVPSHLPYLHVTGSTVGTNRADASAETRMFSLLYRIFTESPGGCVQMKRRVPTSPQLQVCTFGLSLPSK